MDAAANKTTIMLSLQALERLIGGDTELEVGIRQGIVATFARKHLKAIATDPGFRCMAEQLAEDVTKLADKLTQDRIATITQTTEQWRKVERATLHSATIQEIQKAVEKAWESIRQAAIDKAVETIVAQRQENVDRVIEQKVNHRIDDLVKDALRERLKKLGE